MFKSTRFLGFLIVGIFIFSCSETSPKPSETATADVDKIITFDKNIKPLFTARCSPCHLKGGDRSNKYDDYNTCKTLITGIMGRVRKEQNEPLYMPKNGTKLSKSEMETLNRWIEDGLLER
jgi:hypothetical protein